MKRLLLIAVVFIGLNSFAQISEPVKSKQSVTVGKLKSGPYLIAELSYKGYEDDTTYLLMYRNQQYKQIDSYETITFSGMDSTVDKFYILLKSAFSEENRNNKEYSVAFKLGEKMATVSTYKSMGIHGVMFFTHEGYFILNEKQIDKLFGK